MVKDKEDAAIANSGSLPLIQHCHFCHPFILDFFMRDM
jgi:hypothetical protein